MRQKLAGVWSEHNFKEEKMEMREEIIKHLNSSNAVLPPQDSLSQANGLSLSSSAAVSSFFLLLPTPRP